MFSFNLTIHVLANSCGSSRRVAVSVYWRNGPPIQFDFAYLSPLFSCEDPPFHPSLLGRMAEMDVVSSWLTVADAKRFRDFVSVFLSVFKRSNHPLQC